MPEAVDDVCASSNKILKSNSNSKVLINHSNSKIPSAKNKLRGLASKSKSCHISSLPSKAKMSRREENSSPVNFNDDHIDTVQDKSPDQTANR